MRSLLRAFVSLALLAVALPATAQTVLILPTSTLSFTASPDHVGLSLDGSTPLVQKYTVRYCLSSAQTNCLTPIDVGKPAPDGTNTITISTGLWGAIVKNTKYVAFVSAVGPGGSTDSVASGPFGMPGAPAATPAPVIKQ